MVGWESVGFIMEEEDEEEGLIRGDELDVNCVCGWGKCDDMFCVTYTVSGSWISSLIAGL